MPTQYRVVTNACDHSDLNSAWRFALTECAFLFASMSMAACNCALTLFSLYFVERAIGTLAIHNIMKG